MSTRTQQPAASAREFLHASLARAREVLEAHAAQMPGAAAVHGFRVHARRARAALQLFRPLLDKRSRTLGRRLRALARKLAPARDLDVTMDRLAAWRVKIPAELAPGIDPMIARLAAKRRALETRVSAALQAASARKAVADLGLELRLKRDSNMARVAPALLRRIIDRFRKAAKRAARKDTIENLHKLRLRGKELRYVLELLEPLHGAGRKGLLKALRALQECLGECFDALLVADAMRAHPKDPAAHAMLRFTLRKAGARIARLPGLLARVEKSLGKLEDR